MTDVQQDNRPPVYTEQGRTIFRFSSLGGCTRALVLSLRGEEPSETPAWMQAKFDQGRVAEELIIAAWIADEKTKNRLWKMLAPADPISSNGMPHVDGASHGQFNAEIPVGANITIRGKPDGVAQLYGVPVDDDWVGNGDRVGVEVKAFAASYWDKWLKEGLAGFPNYATQVSLQMAATGLPVVFVVGRKDEDGVFSGEIDWRRVSEPPVSLGLIKAKCLKVVALANGIDMPDCDVDQYPCPFFHFHDEKPEVETLPGSEDMVKWADQYDEWNTIAKEADKKKKEASKALMAMIEEGATYRVGDWEVSLVEFDKKEYVVKASTVKYPKVTWKGTS